MQRVIFADGTIVEEYKKPYIIAEVNSSHNGSVEVAKKMIDAAVDAGCDCVKFQSWSTETLYSKSYYKKNPIAKRFVDKLSLTPYELKQMADYCRLKGIGFSSTPYSKEEVDFLVEECDVPFIKIASMEINNPEFLEYIAKKNVPIVLSTGMSDMSEVKNAIAAIENAGNKSIVLLHCVSIYPTPVEIVNLNNMLGLKETFPNHIVGFSDHTLGDVIAIAATALGAAVIEKHITLDAKKIGMDNQMAMEPENLKKLVKRCEEVSFALGTKERFIPEVEVKQRANMRRSIVTTKDLEAGHIIQREDVDFKRPGYGFEPIKINEVLGKKLNKSLEADVVIMPEDLT